MWICSCHAVSDGMIKEFAKANGCDRKKMTKELKVGTQCGTCAKSAKEILEQAAGKPKRKRNRKRKAGTDSNSAVVAVEAVSTSQSAPNASSPADLQSANIGADDATLSHSQSTSSAQLSSPAFLPCGKCTCTCGK